MEILSVKPTTLMSRTKLAIVRRLHAGIWLLLAAAVLGLPVWAYCRQYAWAWAATGLVAAEGAALALNGGQCPLRTLAARYTEDRADGFDIALPPWLARHTVPIFATAFAFGEAFFLWRRFG